MRYPINYYGGKQNLARRIVALLPRHTVYVEPYFGGGAVFFAKPLPATTRLEDYREVINDHNELLVNVYRVWRDQPDAFLQALDRTPYSEAEYRSALVTIKNAAVDRVELARAYFVCLQQSFLRVGGGWRRGRKGQSHPACWRNRLELMRTLEGRFSRVYIACADALQIIEQWDSPQTCFYIDPPYPGADQGPYKGFTQADFEALLAALSKARGSFLLSNYDNRAVPKAWERFEFPAICRNAKTKARTEVVWRRRARGRVPARISRVLRSPAFDCFAA